MIVLTCPLIVEAYVFREFGNRDVKNEIPLSCI